MKLEKKFGKCNLCEEVKVLCKAHIIPRWAFMHLRKLEVDLLHPVMIVSAKRDKRSPTGIWDNEILCGECDNFIGRYYDAYAKRIFINSEVRGCGSDSLGILRNVDTKRLRIFLLSVIWRCSITETEDFRHINLGHYEERIGNLLRRLKKNINSQVDLGDFSVSISKFELKDFPELMQGGFQLPGPVRIYGINCQLIYLPKGFKILIKIDKRPFPDFAKKLMMDGSEVLIPIRPFQGSLEAQSLAAMLEDRHLT